MNTHPTHPPERQPSPSAVSLKSAVTGFARPARASFPAPAPPSPAPFLRAFRLRKVGRKRSQLSFARAGSFASSRLIISAWGWGVGFRCETGMTFGADKALHHPQC